MYKNILGGMYMRRSSVITILLLVLVIVGLVVALVVTNVDFTHKENDVVQDEQNSQNEVNNDKQSEAKEPAPTYISLDSEIVAKMYNILKSSDEFFNSRTGVLDHSNISDNAIQHIAYEISAKNKMTKADVEPLIDAKWTKADMDASVKEIFGDISYTPSDFSGQFPEGKYNAGEQVYYHPVGFGGGGPVPYIAHGIVSVAEYSDRYEVTEKYLYLVPRGEYNEVPIRYFGNRWTVYAWHPIESEELAQYKDFTEAYPGLVSLDEIVSGYENKNIYLGQKDEYGYDTKMKLLCKFYDQAAEYKHTFMKNADGTFYWSKSEIVK